MMDESMAKINSQGGKFGWDADNMQAGKFVIVEIIPSNIYYSQILHTCE